VRLTVGEKRPIPIALTAATEKVCSVPPVAGTSLATR